MRRASGALLHGLSVRDWLPSSLLTRLKHDGGIAGHVPAVVGLDRGRSLSTVDWIFARPFNLPFASRRRGEQRLRRNVEIEVAAQIDQQQPVGSIVAEVAQ